MASKLDSAIVRVAIVIANQPREAMKSAAADAAGAVKPRELAKLPDRWYPMVSTKTAEVPELDDSWDRLWFEAVAEILCQKQHEGVPGLLVLWERDDSTYHELVLIRLLRLAADQVDADLVLSRVRARFETLHYRKTYESVHEVANWLGEDRRPLALLEPMSEIVIPNSDGDTLGKYIQEFKREWGIGVGNP